MKKQVWKIVSRIWGFALSGPPRLDTAERSANEAQSDAFQS